MLISARCGDGLRYQEAMMEKTENKLIVIGADAAPFKLESSQLVEMRISDEWGEVKARAQCADGENQ